MCLKKLMMKITKRKEYDKVRFGRDLRMTLTLHTPDSLGAYAPDDPEEKYEVPLTGRDLKLLVINPSGDACELGFVIDGEQTNVINATYEGRQHRVEGIHHLVLVENLGVLGQDVIRWEGAFLLLKHWTKREDLEFEGEFEVDLTDALDYLILSNVYPVAL